MLEVELEVDAKLEGVRARLPEPFAPRALAAPEVGLVAARSKPKAGRDAADGDGIDVHRRRRRTAAGDGGGHRVGT